MARLVAWLTTSFVPMKSYFWYTSRDMPRFNEKGVMLSFRSSPPPPTWLQIIDILSWNLSSLFSHSPTIQSRFNLHAQPLWKRKRSETVRSDDFIRISASKVVSIKSPNQKRLCPKMDVWWTIGNLAKRFFSTRGCYQGFSHGWARRRWSGCS